VRGDDPRTRRIEAVDIWAPGGVAKLNKRGDELGALSFSTSQTRAHVALEIGPADAAQRAQVTSTLEQLATDEAGARKLRAAAERTRGTVARQLRRRANRIDPTRGGTPLYATIVKGLRQLQADGPNHLVKTLIILTDGTEFPAAESTEMVEQGLDAAVDDSNPVRVLVTATGKTTCAVLKRLLARFDGECFPGRTATQLETARDRIHELSRRPIKRD